MEFIVIVMKGGYCRAFDLLLRRWTTQSDDDILETGQRLDCTFIKIEYMNMN